MYNVHPSGGHKTLFVSLLLHIPERLPLYISLLTLLQAHNHWLMSRPFLVVQMRPRASTKSLQYAVITMFLTAYCVPSQLPCGFLQEHNAMIKKKQTVGYKMRPRASTKYYIKESSLNRLTMLHPSGHST